MSLYSSSESNFVNADKDLGLDVKLVCHPTNSPDLNVLDLGYFHAIQSLQHQAAPQNIDELVSEVYVSFAALKYSKLNDIFLTLQKVMELVILHDGNNNYKLPHISKRKLENEYNLPISISVSDELESKIKSISEH